MLSHLNLGANVFLARCRVLLLNYGRIHPAEGGLVEKFLEIGQFLQIHGAYSLRLINFHAQRYDLLDLRGNLLPHFLDVDGDGNVVLQLSLCPALSEWSFAVEQLIDQYAECPNISFGAVNVVN